MLCSFVFESHQVFTVMKYLVRSVMYWKYFVGFGYILSLQIGFKRQKLLHL